MKIFKIILAAFVIFAAGVVTGALGSRKTITPAPQAGPKPSSNLPSNVGWTKERKAEYIQRLDKYLSLTAEQKILIDAIIEKSNGKMAEHWGTIEPKIKDEYRFCRKQISEILNPEQRKKQEEWRAQKNKHKPQGQPGEQKPGSPPPQKLVPEAK